MVICTYTRDAALESISIRYHVPLDIFRQICRLDMNSLNHILQCGVSVLYYRTCRVSYVIDKAWASVFRNRVIELE